jgi:hypothetical protein
VTSGSSTQRMIRTAPSQTPQVSMSMPIPKNDRWASCPQ